MWHSRPPPPFMANAILNFHFDYLITSLSVLSTNAELPKMTKHFLNQVLNNNIPDTFLRRSWACHTAKRGTKRAIQLALTVFTIDRGCPLKGCIVQEAFVERNGAGWLNCCRNDGFHGRRRPCFAFLSRSLCLFRSPCNQAWLSVWQEPT